jgi:hypothetical protein
MHETMISCMPGKCANIELYLRAFLSYVLMFILVVEAKDCHYLLCHNSSDIIGPQ